MPSPPRSRRSIHFFASSRYCGCVVMTRIALRRSIGTMRMMPASGPLSLSPITLSKSLITDFRSALCSVKMPTDMPDIQLTSKVSIVSSRCRSSSSVPERISMLRKSSGRTVVASLMNGSRIDIICRVPT